VLWLHESILVLLVDALAIIPFIAANFCTATYLKAGRSALEHQDAAHNLGFDPVADNVEHTKRMLRV